MPKAKAQSKAQAPLAERDANVASKKPSTREGSDDIKKQEPDDVITELELDQPGSKRRRSDDEFDDLNVGLPLDLPPGAQLVKYTCSEIRTKIRALINSGEMKVGEFQKAIEVSASSYRGFMGSNGTMGGDGSDTYPAAHDFFVKRDKEGVKTPPAKKAKTSNSNSTKDDTKSPAKGKGKGGKKGDDADKLDVSDITLDEESSGKVPVFDTCDDVRTKINAHLRKPGITMAGLGRTIAQTCDVAGVVTAITGTNVKQFLEKKGPRAGAKSPVFYAAYVYFEKLRVKSGRAKTKKRQEMEEAHGAKGMSTESDSNTRMYAHMDEIISEDRLGVISVSSRSGGPPRRL